MGNVKHLITRNTRLFIMFVCVQLVAVSVILFSYGVANHYNTKIGEVEGTSLKYYMQISPELYVSKDILDKHFLIGDILYREKAIAFSILHFPQKMI